MAGATLVAAPSRRWQQEAVAGNNGIPFDS